MKIAFVIGILFLANLNALCQQTINSFYTDYLTSKNRNKDYFSQVNGSPYENQAFLPAVVYLKDNSTPYKKDLRYNGLFDEMEFLEAGTDKLLIINKKDQVDSILLGGETFVCMKYISEEKTKEGYFSLLSDGNYKLLLRRPRIFVPEKVPTVGYETYQKAAVLPKPDEYYLKYNNEYPELLPSNIKGVQKYFLSKGIDVSKFVNDNKIKYNMTSLIRLAQYVNTIK